MGRIPSLFFFCFLSLAYSHGEMRSPCMHCHRPASDSCHDGYNLIQVGKGVDGGWVGEEKGGPILKIKMGESDSKNSLGTPKILELKKNYKNIYKLLIDKIFTWHQNLILHFYI